jgi:5-methyltetrahydropteroyltriglutamate--homocysteine methyltransferase
MRIVLANHSSYPRVSSQGNGTRLRRAYASRETGKIKDADYDAVARDYVSEIVAEQEAAGCELVTDGIVTWYDLMSRPASRLDGVEINGIVRFFDTNTYVRQPVVTDTVTGSFDLADEYATAAKATTTSQLKAIVTGPYTLARHSIIKADGDVSALTRAYAEALHSELGALEKAGARVVQIEEPSLLRYPEDAELVRNVLEYAMGAKGSLFVSLATYFGDATTIYGELLKMPVDMIALDLVYGSRLVDTIIHEGADKPLGLGLIDGRNTKSDDTNEVAATLARITDALDARGVEEVHLQPSCGLEFLPRDRAKRKLERMREIRDAVVKA